jgi:hypothetical protein
VPSTSAGAGLASTITVHELCRIGSIVAPGDHHAAGTLARTAPAARLSCTFTGPGRLM